MFIGSLTYKVALAEIDTHLDAHRAFLDRHFATGTFLASGPKEPRTGGVILAHAANRQALDLILNEDPFRRLDLATYEIESIRLTRFAEDLPEGWRQRLR